MVTKARKNKIGLTGTGTFHDRAIACCKENGYDYIEINYCQNDIIEQLADLDILLWTRDLESPADALIARHIVYAAELMGVKVCPDTACGWFYDDKISQKYLLEAIQAPLVPTYIFYDQKAALQWSQKVTYPMVLKLSKGAGSKNVILVENQAHAAKLIRKAFARGFKPAGRHIQDVVQRFVIGNKDQRRTLLSKYKRIPQRLKHIYTMNRHMGRESGYVYFQEFIPDNPYDIRITVVNNNTAFGYTRNVRSGDFRASGSGHFIYNMDRIPLDCVRIAFHIADKLKAQNIVFDFLLDKNKKPHIGEISCNYCVESVRQCPGYWDKNLNWHKGHFWPPDMILEHMISNT